MPGHVHFRRFAWAGPLGAVLLGLSSSPAQERPPENATAARIQDGVEKVQAGKLLDAVEQFQRVLDTAGDELVPVGPYHLTRARCVVHGHIARLPSDGVRLYRQRVDGQAARRLGEAKKARDDSGLERLVADMFASRATEEAILELARRAFERGAFDAAEHYWRMLLPPAADDDRLLSYPGPKTDPAAVLAHLVLLKLFRGERDDAKTELESLRKNHGQATGLLAGKTGKYAETLAELVKDPATTTLARLPDEPGWPTFAGSPARTGTLRTRLPYFWPDVPAWRAPLPLLRSSRFDEPPADPLHRRALAFYPVVAEGRAFVSDGARVFSIDLMSGTISRAAQPVGGQDTIIPTRQDIRHTLTIADGVLYARLGQAPLRNSEPGRVSAASCLPLAAARGQRRSATPSGGSTRRLPPMRSRTLRVRRSSIGGGCTSASGGPPGRTPRPASSATGSTTRRARQNSPGGGSSARRAASRTARRAIGMRWLHCPARMSFIARTAGP